jgi:DHA2 family multidrug resistance protein
MTGFNAAVDYGTVAWARVFQSLGLAFLFIPINTVAYVGMPRAKSGYASAIINMARNIGGSFGISLATTVLVRRTQFHQNSLVAHVTPYSDSYSGIVQTLQDSLLGHAGTAAAALHQAQAILYRTVQLQARTLAFLDDFWLLAVIFAGLVPFVLLMRRPQPGAGPRGGH